MPVGTVLGEFIGKVTSVEITGLGGGDQHLESDFTGEAKGQMPGQIFGTMIIEGTAGRSVTYKVTGAILASSGAVIRYSGRGVGIRSRTQGTIHSGTSEYIYGNNAKSLPRCREQPAR
jgi:hypothetical protein